MPEVVEVQIQTEGLRKELLGDVFKNIEFADRGDKIIRPISPEEFKQILIGKTIQDVFRKGKYIIMKLEDSLYLATHLRMTGRYLINVPEQKIGHTRIVFHMKSGKILRYSDVRLFGRISFTEDLTTLEKGLDVFSASEEEIVNQILKYQKSHPDKTVKELLTNQNVLCGLGNVYANETLFKVQLYPGTKVGILEKHQIQKLSRGIKEILNFGYQNGGLSLKDYYHVDGTKGKAQLYLSVYQQDNCYRCDSRILKSDSFDKRTTYYCPKCQRGDD